ncbi:putative methyltransferase NSUN7 [Mya arenaria]|uniref:putative methyltransferase NSUN7 n=1 Tax=Mya arenaria TaxID=6604 RepID=UPI0022E206B4|nr:putative methyltransferase NSUN7 [Mya arenaria]
MPPTADNAIIGFRTSVSLLSSDQVNKQHRQDSMRDIGMMSGDNPQHDHSFSSQENIPQQQKNSKYDFFYKETCLYSHKVYLNAAKVFCSLKHETKEEQENPYYQRQRVSMANMNGHSSSTKVAIQDLNFEDDNEKRLTFQLAYETLKYQRVFEDLLQECSFFVHFPECKEDESLVYVVLWDYQNRKFQARTPFNGEVLDSSVQAVESAILEYKTKLNASLARHRIKAAAPSIEFLLPDKVRSKDHVQCKMPVYVWVNQLKTTVNEVIEELKDSHYSLISPDEMLEGRVVYVDSHCSDMLVLPSESREFIQEHQLLSSGHIVMQDKSSCIAPQSIKYLIGDDDDVIHINAGSGVITAHLASIMHKSSGHIHAFGANPTLLQANLEKLGARHIKVQQEPFLDVETDDNKFKNVKVVLVTADCSKSGITNPIDFVVNEGEDMKILKYLSVGETDDSKLGEMIASHGALLKHAMKLSKVQAIVYMTRSVNESENENVVSKSTEQVNLMQQRKFPWRVVPPVLPFSGNDIERSIGITGKFIKFSPSERNCGCFVAVITREPEDIKEAHKDVLERARARGLLGGKKKSKKPSEEEVEEAEDSPGEDDKLLERRVKRAPRKLRQANSFPLNLPHYNKPSASSIVRSQIYAKPKGVQRATRSTPAINHKGHIQRVKELANPHEKKEKNPVVAEHVKVVKHPAPFSFAV